MGFKTAQQLADHAASKAGDPSLDDFLVNELKSWLTSTYNGWDWPFLQARLPNLTITAGATSLAVTASTQLGSGTLISRILDPIYLRSASNFMEQTAARVKQLTGGPYDEEPELHDTTLNRGRPDYFKVAPTANSYGAWTLKPWPIPDKSYVLVMDAILTPPQLTSAASTPLYPNDRTMEQALFVAALKYLQRLPEAAREEEVLAAMVRHDHAKFGQTTGINDAYGLDSNVFR